MRRRLNGGWAALKPDDDRGSGDDGLGGEGAVMAPSDGDPIEDDPGYSDGPEFEPDPMLTGKGDDGDGGDVWAGFDEATRQLAQQKGWGNPSEMVRSYTELERKMGQREDERLAALRADFDQREAALRRQIEGLQQQQPADPFPEVQGNPIRDLFADLDVAQLSQFADQNGMGAALAAYQNEYLLPRLERVLGGVAGEILEQVQGDVGQRLAPLEQGQTMISLKDQANLLATRFPSEWPRMREEVQAEMQRDRALLRDPRGMQTAFERVFTRQAAEERARRARAGEGETLGGGQRPGAGGRGQMTRQDEDEAIRQAIEGSVPSTRDGLGF